MQAHGDVAVAGSAAPESSDVGTAAQLHLHLHTSSSYSNAGASAAEAALEEARALCASSHEAMQLKALVDRVVDLTDEVWIFG
jgi:hypothetical protein